MVSEFKNDPVTDFSQEINKQKQCKALELVQKQLGREHDLIINGQRIKSPNKFQSISPNDKSQVIGTFQSATHVQTLQAIEAGTAAFEKWKRVPAKERAELLFRTAELLRQRRFENNAWLILEVGKSWMEAEVETCEAIDFCEFYGREALRYAGPQPITKYPGEENELRYIPLGLGAIIPPWNFPSAILAGMTTAAIVCGNTVVLKPSSDSPAIGAFFMSLLEEAGLPPGVVNFVTGGGGTVGNTLIEHPQTRFISFTGSREVGIHINQQAAKVVPGQIWLKRVVAEMGGKDFIIVDESANMEAAVTSVMNSAFGFQGQKCSACSRAIIHEKIYSEFVEKLTEKTKKLKVGQTADPSIYMGAVINQSAMNSILEYIEIGKKEGRLVAGGGRAEGNGFYIQPTIIADVDAKARIAQEEIFGPVLAVTKVKDFDEAIQVANDSDYGLTGSVYSTNREHIERAKNECYAGNFYVNRKCTGALVGVHPFGGFNMSGTDSKAGGRDYLGLFLQAKAISEVVG